MLESFEFFEFSEHMQASCHPSTEITEFFEHMQVSCTDALKSLKMCIGLRFFDAWACKTCNGSQLLEEHMKRGCTRSVRPKKCFLHAFYQ